ncbi:hypothetical protein CWI38_0484p0030 [Hamiltosporidium tvaerminnensis]|uniref:Uncharacterized protein n=1 Tax=Hamiltosporidium tvaerminnensis TaxID=1176355 RepID=A0A4Q9LY03_9MICR|nr:hypothetical protein CWI38_0484p0030 [Hamiltosporidium tvaerminnensis]
MPEPSPALDISLMQEILDNEYEDKRVDTRIKIDYDLLANSLGLIYKCRDGIVTKYHKSHAKRLQLPHNKTTETIYFDRRRELESGPNAEESCKSASIFAIKRYKPKININEESDLKEEEMVVQE